jgi:hypothetical protein
VDVGSIIDVSEAYITSIFMVNVSRGLIEGILRQFPGETEETPDKLQSE